MADPGGWWVSSRYGSVAHCVTETRDGRPVNAACGRIVFHYDAWPISQTHDRPMRLCRRCVAALQEKEARAARLAGVVGSDRD